MGENAVSGTLFGPRMQPRLVEAMGFDFDVVPEKYMLFIRNEDRPGMIGSSAVSSGSTTSTSATWPSGAGSQVPARRWPSPWTSPSPKKFSTPS